MFTFGINMLQLHICSISIGIKMIYNNDYFQFGILKICLLYKSSDTFSKFCLRKIKIFLMCISYMQGELNISSTYRFMMSVSCIEELDNSSLCDTRV